MADLLTAAALADDEAAFRQAVVAGLKELMVATAQLREQNAAWAAHHEETQRRLGALEARNEQQADKAEQHAVNRLQRRIEADWKMIGLAVSGGLNLLQIVGAHLSWRW
jgi:biopolymer transport protein ExbB/TolQ